MSFANTKKISGDAQTAFDPLGEITGIPDATERQRHLASIIAQEIIPQLMRHHDLEASESGLNAADLSDEQKSCFEDFYRQGSVVNRYPTLEADMSAIAPVILESIEELGVWASLFNANSETKVETFHALQEWEGYVTSIGNESFTADLVDLTQGASCAEEQVELPINEIGLNQRDELRVGAVFRWSIGYRTSRSGQRQRVSQLILRQLPKWTKADINAAVKHGSERSRRIRWE